MRRVAVRGIILQDNRLLCFKLNIPNNQGVTKFWSLPGGGVYDNESLYDALNREIIEETGVTPEIGNLLYVHQFRINNTENLEFFFHIKNDSDFATIDLANTSHGMKEIAEFGFIKTSENILPEFLTTETYANLETRTTQLFSYL